jgi:predicted transcriptional regulator
MGRRMESTFDLLKVLSKSENLSREGLSAFIFDEINETNLNKIQSSIAYLVLKGYIKRRGKNNYCLTEEGHERIKIGRTVHILGKRMREVRAYLSEEQYDYISKKATENKTKKSAIMREIIETAMNSTYQLRQLYLKNEEI